ncbi:MAG: hemerythrin domain-containing protein [Deltaproteobacteria bacterium]
MSGKMLEIKYRCQHPSCVVNCREGVIAVDEEYFKELSSAYGDTGLFKSPKGICRMGFNQSFKALNIGEQSDTSEEIVLHRADDPITILKEEHQTVLGVLDRIEDEIKRRDIDALWILTAELENDIILHSIKKEEEVLFPLLGSEFVPMGGGLVAVVAEDHSELLSLLYSFRAALETGDILDGLASSIITNLKSHIRKEDNEFFELVDKCLTDEMRKKLLAGMEDVDRKHVPVKAGVRGKDKSSHNDVLTKRAQHEEEVEKAMHEAAESAAGCCH